MKGTTEQCFRHYISTLPPMGKKRVVEARRPLIDFVGVDPQTVTRWITGKIFPLGLSLLKLRFFLDSLGYQVDELENLKNTSLPAYKLAKMIAHGVVKVSEATKKLDFADNDEIYRIVLRSSRTSSGRERLIEELWEKNKDKVQARPLRIPRLPIGLEPALPHVRAKDQELEIAAHLILALRPLAERIASDEFTPEERKHLRELVKGDGVFHLSNALNRLCGEKAREIEIKKNEELRRRK